MCSMKFHHYVVTREKFSRRCKGGVDAMESGAINQKIEDLECLRLPPALIENYYWKLFLLLFKWKFCFLGAKLSFEIKTYYIIWVLVIIMSMIICSLIGFIIWHVSLPKLCSNPQWIDYVIISLLIETKPIKKSSTFLLVFYPKISLYPWIWFLIHIVLQHNIFFII